MHVHRLAGNVCGLIRLFHQIKMEPSDAEDNNQSVLSATPTEDLKDKMKVVTVTCDRKRSARFFLTNLFHCRSTAPALSRILTAGLEE